jgi:hypothetical protein
LELEALDSWGFALQPKPHMTKEEEAWGFHQESKCLERNHPLQNKKPGRNQHSIECLPSLEQNSTINIISFRDEGYISLILDYTSSILSDLDYFVCFL